MTLHTIDFVRNRSALLLSTVLAIASLSIATLPGSTDAQVKEALKLNEHVEKLHAVVYVTGAKSVDIIQAHIVRGSKVFIPCWKISRE